MTRSDSTESALVDSTVGDSSNEGKGSTPATSMGEDTASQTLDITPRAASNEERSKSRSFRASRSNISSYNLNVLTGSAKHGRRRKPVENSSWAVSGETLVEGKSSSPATFLQHTTQGLDQGWTLGAMPGDSLDLSTGPQTETTKRKSTRLSVFDFASSVVEQTRSVLGKRGRDAAGRSTEQTPAITKAIRHNASSYSEATPSFEGPVAKRLRLEEDPVDRIDVPTRRAEQRPMVRPVKRWLNQGLYVGQDPDFNPRLTTAKNKVKKAGSKFDPSKRRSILPLPMFAGQRILDTGRNYKLPFDVFCPLPPGQPKPDEWKKTHKNVFIGDAAAVWRKSRLEPSRCVCTPGCACGQDCLNRHMFYECDETNCNVGADLCNNRSFERLRHRYKDGGKYNIGVEVIKTLDRGYGVRSNRTFEPHQIIVEYTGEIITQDECDERMETRYKDNECFYLMEFDQKMILDATRGSIARFINHSCEPNCEMIKMTVAGKPRMALFAGENGIMTGEELTYDYNFDPYSAKNVQQCRCGAPSCRGVLGPKPKEIRDALKPLTTAGKRKFQRSIEDGIQTVTKKRKISVPRSVRDALSTVRAQTAETLTNSGLRRPTAKAMKPVLQKGVKKSKSSPLLTPSKSPRSKVNAMNTRRRASTPLVEEKEAEEPREDVRPISRRSSVKATANSVRKNAVRTVRKAGRNSNTASGRRGKSIRVIEDA
ncbi:MAG: hypothetical protein Q9220_005142 [cf. Caloplaca sp. 1 TL-2023]